MTIYTKSEAETERAGEDFGRAVPDGSVVALYGDLGAGKTAFVRGMVRGMGISARVNSPTFTIVQEYREGRLPLFHFDVYRLRNAEDLFEIGADEYFYGRGVCVVEWADLVMEALPEDTKFICIDYAEEENGRVYKCTF